jgi:hypothetical protein
MFFDLMLRLKAALHILTHHQLVFGTFYDCFNLLTIWILTYTRFVKTYKKRCAAAYK